jgi:hypothetical protein
MVCKERDVILQQVTIADKREHLLQSKKKKQTEILFS